MLEEAFTVHYVCEEHVKSNCSQPDISRELGLCQYLLNTQRQDHFQVCTPVKQ